MTRKNPDDHQYWRKYPEQKPLEEIDKRLKEIEKLARQLAEATLWKMWGREAENVGTLTRQLAEAQAEIERLREALEPFAEIAKRAGWAGLTADHPTMTEHVTYAPADDIAPGAVYCLHVSAFVQAHNVLAGGRTND